MGASTPLGGGVCRAPPLTQAERAATSRDNGVTSRDSVRHAKATWSHEGDP